MTDIEEHYLPEEKYSLIQRDYQTYIHKSRYARWLDEYKCREDWTDTCLRYINFWCEKYPELREQLYEEVLPALVDKEVMPSMRAMMTAGKALDRDHTSGYNCSYMPIEHPTAFSELMYILMCGTGVGYSVERQYVSKLPEVPEELYDTDITITVRDSKIGWVVGFKELCSLLFGGQIPRWDLSKIRPAGAVLRTFGGRASGPGPLDSLFRFTVELFKNARGRRLSSIECHDLCCKIADIVVVGGVRRSALISLSNLSDERMAKAKMGEWYKEDQAPYRALANNSVAYTERPTLTAFLREWSNLYESKAGERGIFNRAGARKRVEAIGRRDPEHEWGTNPCSEIILRPYQFCNLSEVIVRPGDSLDDLRRKVRIATIVGTLQSTLTDFRVLRSIWKKNCEEERLLGVSLTGIMDHATLSGLTGGFESDGTRIDTLENWLDLLKNLAIDTNYDWAEKLEINPATAITCVKPSGTVSQLCDTASGIHPRYAQFYIRRVTNDSKDPLCQFLIDQGVPHIDQGSKVLFEFPMESPSLAVTRNDVTAIEQLELWMTYAKYWCEHKPSITVYVKENEWLEVAAFVWKHWDDMSGVAFLPHSDHIYENAPYEEISYEEFTKLVDNFPKLDWSAFDDYESQDNTVASQELACTGGVCEL